MLEVLKKREENNRIVCGDEYEDNDYIYKHADGKPYYPDYPSKAFAKLIKKYPADLPQGITFHGLRTSCVSLLVSMNWSVKDIQKFVGHKDIETTLMIYARVKSKETFRGMAKTMDELVPLKDYKEE